MLSTHSSYQQIIKQLAAIGRDGMPLPATVLQQSQSFRLSSCLECGKCDILLVTYCTYCGNGDGKLALDQLLKWKQRDDNDDDGEDEDEDDDKDEDDHSNHNQDDTAIDELPTKRARLSEPLYASINPVHPNLRNERSEQMQSVMSESALSRSSLVEVRAVPSLSKIDRPCQLGVYATCDIVAGTPIMFYSSQITDANDAQMIASGKEYAKSVPGTSLSQVIDGKPVADMYRRIIPRNAAELAALGTHAAAAFEPRAADYTSGDMQLFASSAKGFMVNTCQNRATADGKTMVTNCTWATQSSSPMSDVAVLSSRRAIREGEELVYSSYHNNESKHDNQSQAPRKRGPKWIENARLKSVLRAISHFRACAKSKDVQVINAKQGHRSMIVMSPIA